MNPMLQSVEQEEETICGNQKGVNFIFGCSLCGRVPHDCAWIIWDWNVKIMGIYVKQINPCLYHSLQEVLTPHSTVCARERLVDLYH
jgi:hypothetical protein